MHQARLPTLGAGLDQGIRYRFIAKPGGGTRTLTLLGDRDRRLFDDAVAAVVPAVERGLVDGVMANRARTSAVGVVLQPWGSARRRFRRLVAAAARSSSAAFVGDVADCYGSISTVAVERALAGLGVGAEDVARVCDVLRSLEERGVRGLPVGPAPSAVLANAVLAPVDRALREAADAPVLRWVDDVVAFASDSRGAERIAAAFHRTLDEAGLLAHPTKCRVSQVATDTLVGVSHASGAHRRPHGMMRRP